MLVSTSSMLYSVQSRFIFTRAAEREKEEREDMFYLSVDDGGGNNLSSSDSSSSSSSSDGLSSSGSSDGSSDEWGDPDPTWVVDENEEAMKREWREREKQKEMLRKRAEIKKRLKAERERRANALGALNAYHRKHHHHDGPAATTGATSGGGGMSVVWDGEVGDEDHREEDMHDRKRDSLALGRARASSLSSDGSGSVLLLPGGLPQSGLFGLKSSASLVRKQPLATGSGSGSATTSSSPPVPRRGPAASLSLEAPRLGKARALAASPLAASQSVWRPQPVFAPATAAGSLSTSPRMVVSPESSPSSSTSTSPSPSPRKATTSSKHGSRRRHSRSMNSTTTAAAANEPSPSSGQRGAEAFERPRAYSAGPQLPPSRDKPKRKGKKERKDETEKKEKKEKKKEKKEKKEVKREKSSAGKRNSKGARLVRALSGGKLTRTGGSTDHDRIKRESFTGVNPALLSDSAAQDNPYIAEYRRERNTPRGGWPATPTTTSQAHEAVDNGVRPQAENEDDEKNECAATAEKNEATRGAAVVREAEEEVVEKKRRGTDSPRNGGSGRRQKTNSSSSAASHSSGSGVALAPRRGVTSTSADSTTRSVKPAIPVLSLGTMSAVRVEPHPHQADAEVEADTLGSEGSSSNAGSGIGSRLGAITPRMVEGFRSIVKKLGKNTTDDRIDRLAGEETAYGDDGEESEEPLSYSGSGSGSDSSESEEVRQRRRMRKRKLEKKRSMSERSLHRSRSLSPTRRTRDLLVGDPQPASSMTTRGKRSGSTLHRETSCRAGPRKGGSERQPRTDRSRGDASWKRTKGESSLTSGGSSPLARSPAVARAAKTSSSARTSPVASPRDAVQRGGGLRNSDSSSSSSSSSSDLASSNERVERRGRTMARRAGDTWGNFLARLSPRTTPRPLHSAASSPNLTTAASSSSSPALPVQRAEDDKAAKASSSRSAKKNKPTRTRSDDRIDWGKDRIHPSTSPASSSSQQLPAGSAGVRSRSLSPVRRTDKVDRKGGKHKKRNH